MTEADYQVEVVSWHVQRETLRSIRGKVFIEEQNVPQDIEWDDQDEDATHFLLTQNTVVLACGRLLPDGKVGRMAVLKDQRGKGLGRMLLNAMVEHARNKGMHRLYLHAQQHAAVFYQGAGFEAFGEAFEEAGIRHLAMELSTNFTGADAFITNVQYPRPFDTLALNLAQTARRNIRIYSTQLDPLVFDSEELASAMITLAQRGRFSDIRILINDARPMSKRGHRLLNLSRRLSSTIKIRVVEEHPELPDATYLVRDTNGVVYKPDDRNKPGFYEPDSRASAKRFVTQFDYLWNWGKVDPRLQLLRL
jgi:predicted GNAT family N-acyltransferase